MVTKMGWRREEAGVAMIEVMIAIVVVSFGLLGVAGLQLAGMKASQVSYYRSVATSQAYDIADRMRANMQGVAAGKFDAVTVALPTLPSCNPYGSSGCVATDMATHDIHAWLIANGRLLPSGIGTITKVANSNAFNIQVGWSEKCLDNDPSCPTGAVTRTFSTQFMP